MSLPPTRADWGDGSTERSLVGRTVAVVALPLALGFGVASGLGAAAGLATATVALDLVTAVIVGLVVAGAPALRVEHIVAYRLDGPLFATTPEAIAHARDQLRGSGVLPS